MWYLQTLERTLVIHCRINDLLPRNIECRILYFFSLFYMPFVSHIIYKLIFPHVKIVNFQGTCNFYYQPIFFFNPTSSFTFYMWWNKVNKLIKKNIAANTTVFDGKFPFFILIFPTFGFLYIFFWFSEMKSFLNNNNFHY